MIHLDNLGHLFYGNEPVRMQIRKVATGHCFVTEWQVERTSRCLVTRLATVNLPYLYYDFYGDLLHSGMPGRDQLENDLDALGYFDEIRSQHEQEIHWRVLLRQQRTVI